MDTRYLLSYLPLKNHGEGKIISRNRYEY